MQKVTILLPFDTTPAERALWESAEARPLVRHLEVELAELKKSYPVMAAGMPDHMPEWVNLLEIPVHPVFNNDTHDQATLPNGTAAALHAIKGMSADTPSVAVINFRNPLIQAQRVTDVIQEHLSDSCPRIAIEEAPYNTAILAEPKDIVAAGTIALIDETMSVPELPSTLRNKLRSGATISHPFWHSAEEMNWTGWPLVQGEPWFATITPWHMNSFMPFIVPASKLAMTRYEEARIHSVLYQQDDTTARRVFPPFETSEERCVTGMDALWLPEEANVIVTKEGERQTVWVNTSLCQEQLQFQLWKHPQEKGGQVKPLSLNPMKTEDRKIMTFHGRQFIGPVATVESDAKSYVWRITLRPPTACADFTAPVMLDRELWKYDPSIDAKVNQSNGNIITGRQNYPQNLSPTTGLAVGKLSAINDLDRLILDGRAKGVLALRDEAITVRETVSLLRALSYASAEKPSTDAEPASATRWAVAK